MAITTTLQPKFTIRLVVIGIVSLVLGLWGVYDFSVRIPKAEAVYQRRVVYQHVHDAMVTTDEANAATQVGEALTAVGDELPAALQLSNGTRAAPLTPDELASTPADGRAVAVLCPLSWVQSDEDATIWLHVRDDMRLRLSGDVLAELPALPAPDGAFVELHGTWALSDGRPMLAVEAIGEMSWAAELRLFGAVLTGARDRAADQPPSDQFAQTYGLVKQRLGKTSKVKKPGALDRITQIAFISCLLMVPWFMWQYHSTRRRVFRLEDDGSLAHPDGRFAKDEIKDIDMSRWMAKSVVWVEGPNGQRVKLDDYVHKNVDLIAGALASDRYPDEWDENARPVKKDEDGGQDGSDDTGTDTGTDDADDEGAEASRETAAGA